MHKICLLSLLAALTFSCQPGDQPPRLRSGTTPILGGTPDHSVEHQAVVQTRNSRGWCSGTLVSRTVVLTAAHCANVGSVEDYMVYFGDQHPGQAVRQVEEIVYHPEYNLDADDRAFDIAMLRLDQQAPDWAEPIPYLPASLGLNPLDLGGTLEYVGFGQDEEGLIGTKLTVEVSIDFVCNNFAGCDNQVDGYHYHAYANTVCHGQHSGTRGVCSGDSGGPGFIIRDRKEYVAAITSYGDAGCYYYGCSTIASAYEDFINEFVASDTANGQPCTNPVECLSGYCRDGVCCDSACNAPCMFCNHPGRPGECDQADDGHPCPDDEVCNGEEYCQAGACSGSTPVDCTSDDPCRVGSCLPGTGCIYPPAEDGLACDNGNDCDGDDECRAGECLSAGVPRDCSDGDPCTADTCDLDLGCQHSALSDGASCSDGDPCNGDEICNQGVCQAEGPLDCDDLNACTEDSCQTGTGCRHERLEDGWVCGDCRKCADGLCLPDKNCGKDGCGCSAANSRPDLLLGLLICLGLFFRRFGSD